MLREEAEAAVLKDEGASAFAQKDFSAAAAKYEEALRLVQPSAVQQEASRFAAEAGGTAAAAAAAGAEADDDDEWSQFNPDLAGNDAAAEAIALAAGRAAESRAALALACALNASLCHARLDPPAWGASAAHATTALALLPLLPPPPPPLPPQVGDAGEGGGGGSDSSGSGAPSAAAAAAAAWAASKCKALYRRGKARLELGELAGAKDDLVGAYALDAGSKDVRRALKALKAARQAEAGRAAERAAAMACGFGRLGTDGVS
jgi:hypothetical protein